MCHAPTNLYIKMIATVAVAIQFVACQAPAENSSLQSSTPASSPGPNAHVASAPSASGVGMGLTSCGAPVGTDKMKSDVKSCLDSKMFYDRQFIDPTTKVAVGHCSSAPIPTLTCQLTDIQKIMSPAAITAFQGYLQAADSLLGFQLDQILDCSSAQAKAVASDCAATVYRLYFVKQVDGKIQIKTLDVNRPQ